MTRPPGASGPGRGQARDGNKKPVRGAQHNGDIEDLGMTVHGTQYVADVKSGGEF